MNGTSSTPTASSTTANRRPTIRERVRMWWQANAEITELTRDRERERRIRAEAAVRLTPNPGGIADLFRR